MSLKKTLHASEQEREDVRAAREKWRKDQAALEGGKLVFPTLPLGMDDDSAALARCILPATFGV